MGVPRFFRWVSERYPQILQKIYDSHPPEYDNLYLDMNGIIHACSQEFANSLIEFSEEELIRKVCNYVDRLFHTIRPTKLFYMAIDGVAPRSKINQQRQRRFLSVHRDEKLKQQLIADGKPVPEVIFNRTAITPGTQFMYNLSESLQFYIKKKISEDLSWRQVQIIFSGPENPGEGEHKIIDYIRKYKASADWDPNQTHCLYGLDADLILLGLVTHEPNFSILREEISFKPTKRKLDFQLLHISLLREYLDLELKTDLDFGYDLEKIIDDFILLMIFFGNDFLPHLPFFEISKGGLNTIFEIYKKCLPTLGGYITDSAALDLDRLQIFLVHLTKFEKQLQAGLVNEGGEAQDEEDEIFGGDIDGQVLEHEGLEEETKLALAFERIKAHFKEDCDPVTIRKDMELESNNAYYRNYFPQFPEEQPELTETFKRSVVKSFVEGLSWVLNYYHNGCISWTWYYPYYYAPLAADFKDIASLDISFEHGEPISPFQQLLSVLPPQSVDLLPECYQELMTDPNSSIIDFYPRQFEIDTRDHHYFDGIAELGFVSHQRLLDATAEIAEKKNGNPFTQEEMNRNTIKNAVIIYHDDDVDIDVESPNSKIFPSITHSSATTEDIVLPHHDNGLRPFRYCSDVLVGVQSPSGFPTLQSLPFTWKYMNAVIDVWGMMSRKESLVVIPPAAAHQDLNQYKSMIGQLCYVNWPYHVEAKIIAFSNSNQKIFKDFTRDNNTSMKLTFLDNSKKIKLGHLRKGIDLYYDDGDKEKKNTSSNLGYDDTKSMYVHVLKLVGVETLPGGRTKKQYSDEEEIFPIELMVDHDKIAQDSRFEEVSELPFEKRFPLGKQVLYTKKDYYGAIGTVTNHYDNQLQLDLRVPSKHFDLHFGHNCAKEEAEYFSIGQVAKMAQISISNVSLLTAGLFISKPMVDIGLNMKFTGRQQQVLGYCRGYEVERNGIIQKQWEFSKAALDLILEYLANFPIIPQILTMFSNRGPESTDRSIDISTLFKTKEEKNQFIEDIQKFIENSGIRKKRIVPCGTFTMTKEGIEKIQNYYGKEHMYTHVSIHANVDNVVEPSSYESIIAIERHHVIKSQKQFDKKNNQNNNNQNNRNSKFNSTDRFNLGDRVVTILDKGNVPFGRYGTVTSIQDQKIDVILDQDCFSATDLEGTCHPKRGICISKQRVFNLSNPTFKPKYKQPTYDDMTDPAEYWEKLQDEDTITNGNNNNNNNNNNRKRQQQQQHNNNNVNVSIITEVNIQQTSELSWQQKELLQNIGKKHDQQHNNNNNNNNGSDIHPLYNTTNSVNYPMKKIPVYTKNNFAKPQELSSYGKVNPKLKTTFYYDQDGNKVYPPQKPNNQNNNNQQQQGGKQQQQQKQPKQKKVQEPIDPQKMRKQGQLNLIYDSIEPNAVIPEEKPVADGETPTNPSAILLLNNLFNSATIQETIPPPPHAMPPPNGPYGYYAMPPPNMPHPFYGMPHPPPPQGYYQQPPPPPQPDMLMDDDNNNNSGNKKPYVKKQFNNNNNNNNQAGGAHQGNHHQHHNKPHHNKPHHNQQQKDSAQPQQQHPKKQHPHPKQKNQDHANSNNTNQQPNKPIKILQKKKAAEQPQQSNVQE